ncbi:MAG TPA: hypothetical protein VLW45_00985 [Pelomicrobium sp.]|nr:hypothetical protein [Pelomicrobium sp.]
MIGELWDDPRDERPEEDLDDDPEVFDEDSELDDELETLKVTGRYVPADLGDGC